MLPVALVGMMAVGKTSVGRSVSRRLGVPWFDTDRMISRQTNRSIPDIFETDGEAVFRELETAALAEALDGGGVISCGGGVVTRAVNRELLTERARLVVWLRADATTIGRRVGRAASRPMLKGKPAEMVQQLIDERTPLYDEVAHLVIDVDELTSDRVSAIVVETALRGSVR